jgi:hypothetical protein
MPYVCVYHADFCWFLCVSHRSPWGGGGVVSSELAIQATGGLGMLEARAHGKVVLSGHTIQATISSTMLHAPFLSGNLDDSINCDAGTISFPNDKT